MLSSYEKESEEFAQSLRSFAGSLAARRGGPCKAGYARITDTKVSNDMDVLQENLQGVFDKPLTQSIKSRKMVAHADPTEVSFLCRNSRQLFLSDIIFAGIENSTHICLYNKRMIDLPDSCQRS